MSNFKNMLFSQLFVILSRPKISENVGSVARVCANFGCFNLSLVAPHRFDRQKAGQLATSQGEPILDRISCHPQLSSAVDGMHRVYATTARTGGWRKRVLLPNQAAAKILDDLQAGAQVGIIFGPEDTGLANQDIEQASELITIPTVDGAWSLNLAHAVLIVLYECFQLRPLDHKRNLPVDKEDFATHAELSLLFRTMQETLQAIDYLQEQSPEYFMMPLRRYLGRQRLRRYEFNLLMGICRQVRWIAAKSQSTAHS